MPAAYAFCPVGLQHALLGLAPGTGQRNNLSLTLAWRERELAARTTAAKAPGDAAGKWGVAGAAARRRK